MSSSNIYTLPAGKTLTLNSRPNMLNTMNISFGEPTTEFVKKYEVIETTEDLLALSCAWYRIRKNPNKTPYVGNISSLISPDLFRQVTEEDRVNGNTVRDYYSKKIMMWTLREKRLSQYRQDLNAFLHGDSKKVVERTLPLVFRLPEFYEYDVKFDEVKQEFTREINNNTQGVTNLTLTPVIKFQRSVRKTKISEYWLKDAQGYAYQFVIDPNNSLAGLWEKEFSKPEINIVVNIAINKYSRDDLHFFQIKNFAHI
jgi:hypothetical protein